MSDHYVKFFNDPTVEAAARAVDPTLEMVMNKFWKLHYMSELQLWEIVEAAFKAGLAYE